LNTIEPDETLHSILEAKSFRSELVANALRLVRANFGLDEIRQRFWLAIESYSGGAIPTYGQS
jgi:hypothetical protein